MKTIIFESVLIFLISLTAFGQQNTIVRSDGRHISTRYVDSVVRQLMDTAAVTGLQIGIISNGKPVYIRSYGYKNRVKGQLNDTSTCFYGASLAKSLFAYLVMQLVDEQKIDLDKPVYQYLPKPLPEYDNYKDLVNDDRWKQITPRMCLAHTTGFPNWREINKGRLDIQFKPGTKYAYSGEGIMLLQLLVETITGKPVAQLARERIFNPFGLTRSDYVWQARFENDYAVGHNLNEDTLAKIRYKEAYAAGSMETTIADYTRFMAMVLQHRGLSRKIWNEMLSPQIAILCSQQAFPDDTTHAANNRKIGLSYGLGWGLFNTTSGKAFFKEGHLDGWVHYAIGFPQQKAALVIMSNSSNGESIFKELVEKLAGVAIPWYWEMYTPYRPNVKVPANILQQYTGVYNGRLKAIITLEAGRLKVESPTVNLPKTNMYAINENHFYLKVMDTDIEFVKDASGKVIKAVLNDEGEHYELVKVE